MSRLSLQAALEAILGSRNVYFQPPENIKLSYPCIVYEPSSELTIYANNDPYNTLDRYTVTLIDKNPDSVYRNAIRRMRTASFNRFFRSDNLNHFVYTLYY